MDIELLSVAAARERRDAREVCAVMSAATGLANALSDLRRAPTSSALLEGAPRALCDACGFTRAMVSAVQGSRWVPLILFTSDRLDPQAEAFQAFVGSETEIPFLKSN